MDLETRVDRQWKLNVIEQHPLYKTLPSEEKEQMAKSITDEQAIKLAESTYGKELVDTEKQIFDLQEKLQEIEQASNAAWTNGDLKKHYTPKERRTLVIKQFIDDYFATLMGSDNASKYQAQLIPQVQERFKNTLLQTVVQNAKTCEKRAQNLDELIGKWEEEIDKYQGSIEYNDNTIDIANSQAIEISAEYEDLKETNIDYTDPQAPTYVQKNRERRAALRKKSRFFESSKRKACSTIRADYRRLMNTQKRLNVARAIVTPLHNLAAKYQDIADNLHYYSGEEPTLINANELSDIMNTYKHALQIVLKHDSILDTGAASLIESTPDNLGDEYDLSTPTTVKKDFAKEQSRYEREARSIAKLVRGMEF